GVVGGEDELPRVDSDAAGVGVDAGEGQRTGSGFVEASGAADDAAVGEGSGGGGDIEPAAAGAEEHAAVGEDEGGGGAVAKAAEHAAVGKLEVVGNDRRGRGAESVGLTGRG